MLIYILKFSACLSIFIVFYKLFLEKENMHFFKRFYLLAAIALAIGIPLVTFIEYIEPLNTLGAFKSTFLEEEVSIKTQQLQENPINYLPNILWSIYGLGVLLFGVNFLRNLYQLNYKIKHNPKQKNNRITNVLLKDLVIPHTFFNYIFLNKRKFETHQIPKEVFWHEETHAIQKHSIDVLVIEMLQIVFWFNPLIYIIKHVMKLNHEFLADQAVLKKGVETATYQETLLAFSSNASHPQLVNAINYSYIKKRFTVMKTQTSKKAIWLRSLVLLPLLAIMLYGFSSTKKVEKGIFSKTSATNHTARSISIKVFNNGTYEVDDIKATKKTFVSVINQLHQDITPKIRNKIINIHVSSETDISDKEVWFIYNSVIDYGFHRIVTNNQEIIREKGNKPFAITRTYTQEHSETINEKIELQKGASKAQIAEYNKLAKKYNGMPKHNMVIKNSDLERLRYLYDLMSVKQRKKAEPFPKLAPPPPPAPDAPKAPKVRELRKIPPPPPLPKNAIEAQKKTYKESQKKVYEQAYRDAKNVATARKLKTDIKGLKQKDKLKLEKIAVSTLVLEILKSKKEAYEKSLKTAKTSKQKAELERLIKINEGRSSAAEKTLKYRKKAWEDYQAILKTQKEQLVKVKEIHSAEDMAKLKEEKKAYKKSQAKEKTLKKKSNKKENK